jgi:hypothetical protein
VDNPRLNTPGRFNITLNPTANLSVEPGQSQIEFFATLHACTVVMEACAGAHHMARKLVGWAATMTTSGVATFILAGSAESEAA